MKQKKKADFRRLFALLLIILMSSVTYAGDVIVNGIEFKIKKKEGIAIAVKANPDEIPMVYALPAIVKKKGETFKVTTVAKGCFKGCTSLTTLTLPENVRTIEKKAFRGCTSLSEITIPTTALEIDDDAFEDCANLKNFIWFRNIDGVIYSMKDFKGQPKTAILVGVCDKSIKNFSVPEDVNGYTLIGVEQNAFQPLKSLERLVLPNTIKEIPSRLFANLTLLKYITLPTGLTELNEGLFDGCKNLSEVNIPANIKSFGNDTFRGCEKLKNIQIPIGVTVIPSGCFAQTGLKNFVIPVNITQIGRGAFAGCPQLESLEVPISVSSLPVEFAEGCPQLQTVTFPETLTSIGANAFKNCSTLVSINIPANLETIGEECFMGTAIPEMHKDVEVDGVTYMLNFNPNGDRTAVAMYVADTISSTLALPRIIKGYQLTEIGENCFKDNERLISVNIPLGVTSIKRYAFSGCVNLASVMLPTSLRGIYYKAFSNCSKLSSISIPSDVDIISDHAFSNCSNLKTVKFPTNLKTIGMSAFNNCSMLEEADLSVCNNLTIISEETFSGCKQLRLLKLPKNLTTLRYCAFYDCPSLEEVIFPASLTAIGEYAFAGERIGLKKAYFQGAKLSSFGYAGILTSTETYRLYDDGSTLSYNLPPTARINNIKLEHNVMVNGVKGMNIVINFDIQREKGCSCRASAYFYFSDGTALKDFNSRYKTTDGNASSYRFCS